MTLRFHEIAEARHRILNPISDDKLRLLGEICHVSPGDRVLDLCCGKAEMLCTWSARHQIRGVGVDISEVFLAAARQRRGELQVDERVELVHGEAAEYARTAVEFFDVVTCIGATWIGGGLTGTLALIDARLGWNGVAVVGECYLTDPLPAGVTLDGVAGHDLTTLEGTLDQIDAAGFELIEMVLADHDSWDRYIAAQWSTVSDWLRANRDDPDADALRSWIGVSRRTYLAVQRRYLGWGAFVMRRR